MKEWTGIEIERARQNLEDASATILGRMIFAFSRLDVSLGLLLVWVEGGAQLEKANKEVGIEFFNDKLVHLQRLVAAKYESAHEANMAYCRWLKDAHSMRVTRNDLIHGRWGTDPMKNEVVNVVGLPTSPEQYSKRYTIEELKNELANVELLQVRLAELREQWSI